MVTNNNLKYLLLIILVFFLLGSAYILVNPIFEGPDAAGHFAHLYHIAKYNSLPLNSTWEESEGISNENFEDAKSKNYFFLIKGDFALVAKDGKTYWGTLNNPPLYYLISSFFIKPLDKGLEDLEKLVVDPEEGLVIKENGEIREYVSLKILDNNSRVFDPVVLLRFIQLIYGVFNIIILYKIIQLIVGDKTNKYSIILISSICFLPRYIFLYTVINNDAFAILLGITSIYFLISLIKKGKSIYGYLSLLFSIAALLSEYHTVPVFLTTLIYFVVWQFRQKKLKEIILFFSIAVGLSAIVLFLLFSNDKTNIIVSHFIRSGIGRVGRYVVDFTKGYEGFKRIFSKDSIKFVSRIAKTSIATFDNNHIVADKFVYYFYYSFILCGLVIFFKNIKKWKKNFNILIFFLIIIFMNFMTVLATNAAKTEFRIWGGRVIFIAVILVFIISLIGYENLSIKYKKILYPILFGYFIIINLVCVYMYIYLPFYKDYMVNYKLFTWM